MSIPRKIIRYCDWANCGIAKHHGSLVTEQNFAKHCDRIFSSTGSFINSNLWKIQIIVQLNLNFKKICTSCSIFVRSFWFIQATDSEIFNMPYGILEMRNDQFSKESGTNFAVFHSIKVSTWLNYFLDNRVFMAHHLHKEHSDRVVFSGLRSEVACILVRSKTTHP